MDLTFLSGSIPLTKTITYSKRDDHYTTAPYPLIQRVTSTVQSVRTINEFAQALKHFGSQGACLLKGGLDQPLVKQSRAGHSVDAPHEWLVFDFDKVDCTPDFDGALQAIGKYLPAELAQVDCVVQLSASCARPDATRLSAHVFILLERPVETRVLTDWFTALNFQGALQGELGLTDSGQSLRFPLDRSVSSPAKLIYIAPARCVGFESAQPETIRTYAGKRRRYALPAFAPVSNETLSAKINALRTAANLPERQYRTRHHNGNDILIDAEECVVHDIKSSGDGYIRFNMNGGDSQAYFVNLREPGVIGNFKGEPYLMTAQAAPDLFKALTKAAKSLPAKMPSAAIEPLAFYATNRQSQVYIGAYDRERDELRVDPSTLTAAYSWLANFGVPVKQALPHYDLVFDVNSDVRFEDGYPVINLYAQTEYLKQFAQVDRTLPCEAASLGGIQVQCPTLWRTIHSALGGNHEAALYFINWLAAIFQRRTRTMSAWIMHGEQGTGKGLIFNYILAPLFGPELVTLQNYSILKKEFNAFLEGRLIVAFDEADMAATDNWAEVRSKIYSWITEPRASINAKGKDARDVDNNANFLFYANNRRPMVVEDGDRRFNVGEFQPDRLLLGPNDLAALEDQRELKPLAQLLGQWQVNDDMLIQPYGGKAKETIYEATHNLLDRIARAIHQGDTQFFVDNRPDDVQRKTEMHGRILPIREYDALLEAMVDRTLNVLTPTDLYVLFRMVAVSEKIFPDTKATQRQIYQRYGLLPGDKTIRDKRTGKTVRGCVAPEWATSHDLREQVKVEDAENVVIPMRKK